MIEEGRAIHVEAGGEDGEVEGLAERGGERHCPIVGSGRRWTRWRTTPLTPCGIGVPTESPARAS